MTTTTSATGRASDARQRVNGWRWAGRIFLALLLIYMFDPGL